MGPKSCRQVSFCSQSPDSKSGCEVRLLDSNWGCSWPAPQCAAVRTFTLQSMFPQRRTLHTVAVFTTLSEDDLGVLCQQISTYVPHEGNRKCSFPWLLCCRSSSVSRLLCCSDGPPSFCLLAPVGCPLSAWSDASLAATRAELAWLSQRHVSFQKLTISLTALWIYTALALTATTKSLFSLLEEKQDAGERRRKTRLLPEQERKYRSKWHSTIFDMRGVIFCNI